MLLQSFITKLNPACHCWFLRGLCALIALAVNGHLLFAASVTNSADYAAIDAIFTSKCLDCHASKDPEGELVLDSYESLMKGGQIGPAILPGNSSESLLIKMIE